MRLVWAAARSWDRPYTGVATVLRGGAPVVMPRGLGTSLNLVKKHHASVSFSFAYFLLWWLYFRVHWLVDPFGSELTMHSNSSDAFVFGTWAQIVCNNVVLFYPE